MRLRALLCLLLFLMPFAVAQQAASAQPAVSSTQLSATPRDTVKAIPSITPASSRPADIEAATNAWLATVPAAERARTNAYFEGGYWVMLWDFLIGVALSLILLNARISARMRDAAERITRFKPVQTFLYFVEYAVLTFVVTFPMAAYEAYFREKKYGLMNMSFGGWFNEFMIGNLVGLLVGGIAVVILFGIVRRVQRTWWIWGAVFSIAFMVVILLASPVYFDPLFNHYKKLDDPKLRDSILSMARANGVPATDVYEFDASKQSKRVSANVSGFLGTERIALNDNLLNRCTPTEVQSVMGHEMGHYVLNHVYKMLLYFGVVVVVFFAYLKWALGWTLVRWGEKWKIRGIGDPAVLPLVVLLASIFFFVIAPLNNTYIRVQEQEADIFGLNAARQPDAEAHVDLLLGEYRKLDPGPVEEFVFFDHPSGRNRIYMAMRWKAEHMHDADFAPVGTAAAK
jgi:STE24 endopeptidase